MRNLALFLISFFVCGLAYASDTYFISPSGQDDHDGTSEKAAWKSVAKVNSATFKPGDRVLFQRGGEWREAFAPSCDGTAENPIVFAAYGTGAKPKFWGSRPLDNAKFLPDGDNCYKYVTDFPVDRHTAICIDHEITRYAGPHRFTSGEEPSAVTAVKGTPNSSTIAETGPNSSTIWVNTGGTHGSDPRTDGKQYTAVVLKTIIHSAHHNHLVFRDLVADECPSQGSESFIGFWLEGGEGLRVENCEAYRCGYCHYAIWGGTTVLDHCTAAYLQQLFEVGDPNSYYYAPSPSCAYFLNQNADVTLRDCSATNLEGQSPNSNFRAVFAASAKQMVLDGFSTTGHGGGGLTLGTCASTLIKGGVWENSQMEMWCGKATYDGVTFKGSSWIDCGSNDNLWQNCVFDRVSPPQIGAFDFRNGSSNNVIRFCTVVCASESPIHFFGTAPNLMWYGNIFIAPGLAVYAGDPANFAGSDYNLYAKDARFLGNSSFDDWKALGLDRHSLAADPMFVNPQAGDYSLAAGSPGIDAVSVPAKDIPVTDYNGNPRPRGGKPDMGAIENESSSKH